MGKENENEDIKTVKKVQSLNWEVEEREVTNVNSALCISEHGRSLTSMEMMTGFSVAFWITVIDETKPLKAGVKLLSMVPLVLLTVLESNVFNFFVKNCPKP